MSMEEGLDSFLPKLTFKYTVSRMLGHGACREVRLESGCLIFIGWQSKVSKSIMTTTSSILILNEVQIPQSVDHPCITNLEDVVDSTDYLYIVLKLAECGEHFDKIIKKTTLNEAKDKLF